MVSATAVAADVVVLLVRMHVANGDCGFAGGDDASRILSRRRL